MHYNKLFTKSGNSLTKLSPIATLVLSTLIIPIQAFGETTTILVNGKDYPVTFGNDTTALGYNLNSNYVDSTLIQAEQNNIEINDKTLSGDANNSFLLSVYSIGNTETNLGSTTAIPNSNANVDFVLNKSNINTYTGIKFTTDYLSKLTANISDTTISTKENLNPDNNPIYDESAFSEAPGSAISVLVDNGSSFKLDIENTRFNATTALDLSQVREFGQAYDQDKSISNAVVNVKGGSIRGDRALVISAVNTEVTFDGTDINVDKEGVFLSSLGQGSSIPFAAEQQVNLKDSVFTFKNLTLKAPIAFVHGNNMNEEIDYDKRFENEKIKYGSVVLENTIINSEILANDKIYNSEVMCQKYPVECREGTLNSIPLEIPDSNEKNESERFYTSALDIKATKGSQLSGRSVGLHKFTINDSSWDVKGDSWITSLTTENADIHFDGANAQLKVEEDYKGGARFHFRTKLGNTSETNKLIFEKDVSGTSQVIIYNQRGGSMKTSDGETLLQVLGKTSPNAFKLENRVLDAAEELFIKQCNNSSNWCYDVQERAEAATYAQNAEAANKMFNLRLHDRLGDVFMQNTENKRIWIRHISGNNDQKMLNNLSSTHGARKGIQLGGDILNWKNNENYAQFGFMVGYGKHKSNSTNEETMRTSSGQVNGYSIGVYGTWYQNKENRTGAYIDSWINYNWFRNQVNSQQFYEKYKSKGFNASIETGYNFLIADNTNESGKQFGLYIQPQAQITYMGIKGKHTEENGTQIRSIGNNNLQTRVGIRTYLNVKLANNLEIQPFVEVNSLHQPKRFGVAMDDEERYISNKKAVETKVGMDINVKNNLKIWASFTHQSGKHQYKDKQGTIGMKFEF